MDKAGSILMGSADFEMYNNIYHSMDNISTICMPFGNTRSSGVFHGSKSLEYPFTLLMAQLSFASIIILLCFYILKPLGQPSMIAQIIGGIVLGPSILGRASGFTKNLFPLSSFVILDIMAEFGYMFFSFLIGVRIDLTTVLKKIRKREIIIGMSTVALALVLAMSWSILTMSKLNLPSSVSMSLPPLATSASVLSFPMMAQYLTELKIINSEFGRLALSCSVVSNIFGFCIITSTVLVNQSSGDRFGMLTTLGTGTAMGLIIFALRPVLIFLMKRKQKHGQLQEGFIYMIFLGVLLVSFISHAIGLHLFFGPLVFGLSIPAGPPLGSALVEKLELINSWLFMPVFFVKNGLVIDIFDVQFKNYLVLQLLAIIAGIGKFLGALISALYCCVPARDGIILGLAMNVEGVLELGLYKMLKQSKTIDRESFTVMCTSMLLIVFIITVLIRYLYDPSRRYAVYEKRTIMDARHNSELQIVACLHDQEDVPITISLLEAINPTKRSPVIVYIVHLIELSGRAHPLLINHKLSKRPSTKASTSKSIVNAFRYFEQCYNGYVSVYPYTAISNYETLHDEICTMALDRQVPLILIPFHKRFGTNNTWEAMKRDVRLMNDNVLDMAPCSVGIIVDRGLHHNSRPTLATWSSYRVCVFFLGGADDREALAIAAKMAAQPNICLTVVRVIEDGGMANYNTTDSILDNEILSQFRLSMAGRNKVTYIEEEVRDGTGTVSALTSMEEKYELIIVGRYHDKSSKPILGIADWTEESELGTIGDIVASPDFRGNTTILVVQQHAAISGYKWSQKERETNMPPEIESVYSFPVRRANV